jgi:hypothetical protein
MASVRENRASVPDCTHSSAGLTPTFFSTSFPVPFSKMKCDRLMLAKGNQFYTSDPCKGCKGDQAYFLGGTNAPNRLRSSCLVSASKLYL